MISTILWGLILENYPKSILEEIEQWWKSGEKNYVCLDLEIFLLLQTIHCTCYNEVFVFFVSSTITMSLNKVPEIQGGLLVL